MKKRTSKLKAARERNELARLSLDSIVRERKAKFVASYDATESNKHRRQPAIEFSGEDSIYDQRKRHLGANIGRDLERNYAPAKGMLHQFRMNVVGSLGKIQVNVEKGGDDAAAWFNQVWAKDCDFRDEGMHWSETCQNVTVAPIREGDLLAVVDDGIVPTSMGGVKGGTGKLLHWESDQIVSLAEGAIPTKYKEAIQENGIMRDKIGKVLAYVTTGQRGLTNISEFKDATIWLRDNARHIKNPWRMNQGRGVPSLLASATNFIDLYEILAAELLSAKRAAVIAGYTKRDNAITDWDSATAAPGWLPENSDKSTATTAAEGANSTTDPSPKNYEAFENLTGGNWEYVDKGDEINFPDIKRPNVAIAPFIEAVMGFNGASLGLARAYSLLRADSSYTSFRGDMILTWASAFYPTQKWLERRYADWVGRKVLAWAQKNKKIGKLSPGWERTLSWKWPTMPHVDEAKESIAEAQSIKNGTTDYSKILGPEWRKKFQALSEQLAEGRDLGLPLSAFEQKSGGVAPSEETTTETNDKESDDSEGEGVDKWLT